ncbi:MAG: hypothetical protein J2P16_03795 [Mycobacterium sp.]|nr:hypothetical protein [Mycobacterium sp.]
MAAGIATGSSGAASAVAPARYVNPLRAAQGLVGERIDEGVDYVAEGGSPVYALGNGIVTNIYNSGWPNGVFLVYQLTSGPAQGLYVYVAEDVTPAVTVGQQVTPGTVLARFEAGADGGYDIEMGWADPCSCGQALAATYGQYPVDGDATAFGRNFNDLMTSLGAPVGSIQGRETGSLPTGRPVWTASKAVQHVFFAGRNGHLFESFFRPFGWRGQHDMCTGHGWGCTPSSSPGVAVNPATNDQYVFWRGAHGDINEAFRQSGAWRGPIDMCIKKDWGCAVAAGAPDVAVGEDGSQYVVYRGANGHLFESVFGPNGWRGEHDMCTSHGWGCNPSSAASVAVNPATDDQYVFWRGTHGDINEAFDHSGAWRGPINMCTKKSWGCAAAAGAPDVAVGDDGSQYVVYSGADGHNYEAFRRSGAWHGALDMCASYSWGCTPSSAASVAVNPATDEQYVFWRSARGDINEAFHQSGAWHGPINMCVRRGWGCRVASAAPSVAVSASGTPPPAEPLATPPINSPPTSTRTTPARPSPRRTPSPKPSTTSPPASPTPSTPSSPPRTPSPKPSTSSSPAPPTPSTPSSPTPSTPSPKPSTSSPPASPTPSTPSSPTPSTPSPNASRPSPTAPTPSPSAG